MCIRDRYMGYIQAKAQQFSLNPEILKMKELYQQKLDKEMNMKVTKQYLSDDTSFIENMYLPNTGIKIFIKIPSIIRAHLIRYHKKVYTSKIHISLFFLLMVFDQLLFFIRISNGLSDKVKDYLFLFIPFPLAPIFCQLMNLIWVLTGNQTWGKYYVIFNVMCIWTYIFDNLWHLFVNQDALMFYIKFTIAGLKYLLCLLASNYLTYQISNKEKSDHNLALRQKRF
eukprot:TRINITY_DN9753_c0_g1_i1.p1 TRINITY_DN9753_c0_g1~~TRINITY_DN9753_c0_g1_i1.p1  ORF type:complete len:226 (-),score=5.91 TRINITY_DN9753_c0_g1_i1:249-926(-)